MRVLRVSTASRRRSPTHLTLPDPPIRSRYVIGSSHGWIITADKRSELHLVNPITGDQIALPSVTTIEQVKPIFDDAGAVHKYEYSWDAGTPQNGAPPSPSIFPLDVLRNYLFGKAFLSSDPSMGDYFVVLIHNPRSLLSFARAGDDKWTWLPLHVDHIDCMFKDGLLYALTAFGEVRAFDLSGPAVAQSIFPEVKVGTCGNMYIAQAPCGDMLQIWRSSTSRRSTPGEPEDEDVLESNYTSKIAVFKVDFAANMLVDITGSGDNVLFLGHNQSPCLSADAYPQLKSSHAYFTDNDWLCLFGSKKISRRGTGVLDLENGSVEEIVSPQWVIPNPRKINSAPHD